MEWWRWAAVATLVVIGVIGVLLILDSMRERTRWHPRQAVPVLAGSALVVPLLCSAAVIGPWWLVVLVVTVPALALLALAMAS